MSQDRKRLVIIGGGHAGVRFIHVFNQKRPNSQYDIVLIDKKDFYELNFFNLWDLVAPRDLKGNHRIPYTDFIKGNFMQGTVIELTKTEVILESGGHIPYDYAIISTGTSYPRFSYAKSDSQSSEEMRKKVDTEHELLQEARSILIIGGGSVGVELAGGIKARIPHLEVQLVDMAPVLLSRLHPKAQKAAYNILNELGVKVYLNESVDLENTNGTIYKTSSGKRLSADRVYFTIGPKLNTQFMTAYFSSSISESGEILVSNEFRVKNTENLFSLGDCAATGDPKHGSFTLIQGAFLASNFNNLISRKSIKSYKHKPLVTIVPVGDEKGIIQIGKKVIVGKFFTKIKHSKFFLNYVRKSVGIPNI